MHLRFSSFALLLMLSAGCGKDELPVAESVSFKVNFESKIVEIGFKINSDYSIQANNQIRFEQLALKKITWRPEQAGEVGMKIRADRDTLGQAWPGIPMEHLPNLKKFPAPVRGIILNGWSLASNDLQFTLYYRNSENLQFGGGVSGSEFSFLPWKFDGLQTFKDRAGEVRASLVILGPHDNGPGGFYYFSDLGFNPFEHISEEMLPPDYQFVSESEIAAEFKAAGPMKFSETLPSDWSLYIKAKRALDSLAKRVQNFILLP